MPSPRETTAEKPIARVAAHSTSPAAIAPDCEIRARSPGGRACGGEARIEPGARHQHAEAVGTDEPQALGARRRLAALGQRARPMAETGGDDDAGRACPSRRRPQRCRHRLRRRRDDDQVGGFRQRVAGLDRADRLDLVVVRIDEMDRALEAAAREGCAGPRGPAMSGAPAADNGDRARREKLVETIGGHS